MQNLENKLALVTGASSGIGKGIADALADGGARVVLVASNPQKLSAAVATMEAKGQQAYGYACDLYDTQAFFALHDQIVAEHGHIDILVNNVGVGTFKPMHMMSREESIRPAALPFEIAVAASHAVIPAMLAQGSGHIVNLISPAGIFPLPYMVPYTAARYAMRGLSHALYEELHHQGIGVTLVCPSQVNTGYFDNNDADMGWYPKLSKIFPVLEPEDVGKATVKGIRKDRREVITPFMLWFMVRCYSFLPRMWVALFKLFGLWGPSKSVKPVE